MLVLEGKAQCPPQDYHFNFGLHNLTLGDGFKEYLIRFVHILHGILLEDTGYLAVDNTIQLGGQVACCLK